jgi:hypothetical protein
MNLDSLESDGLLEAVLLDVTPPKRDLLRGRYEALVKVAKAAESLQETEWVAFIGWAPSADREQAIESSHDVLREALAALRQRP